MDFLRILQPLISFFLSLATKKFKENERLPPVHLSTYKTLVNIKAGKNV